MAVDDDSGNFVGYFNYKPPHHPSLEIGLGMHPDWTGRGLGQSLVEAGFDYARSRYAPEEFLLSRDLQPSRDQCLQARRLRPPPHLHALDARPKLEFIEMRRAEELAD